MTRFTMPLLLIALLFAAPHPTAGAPVPKNAKEDLIKEDLARLAGKWRVISVQIDGDEQSAENVAAMAELTFKDREFRWSGGSTGSIADIDPTHSPKFITYKYGNDQEKVDYGIYMITGDVLVDCFAGTEEHRPKEFVSKPTSKHTLMVYKRIRDKE